MVDDCFEVYKPIFDALLVRERLHIRLGKYTDFFESAGTLTCENRWADVDVEYVNIQGDYKVAFIRLVDHGEGLQSRGCADG